MIKTIPKRLIMISDMVGFGRCSSAVSIPIISACKVQACFVPTAFFSNHLAYPVYFKKDLTGCMEDYLKPWDTLELKFDGIYCGFLSSIKQMKIAGDSISAYRQKKEKSDKEFMVLIDPVMGDHGTFYKTVTNEFCVAMKEFVKKADVITPNITEACLLTGIEYKEGLYNLDELSIIAGVLHEMGPGKIVITGIHEGENIYNYISEKKESGKLPESYLLDREVAGAQRPGTGDIFASILAALSVRDFAFQESVNIAADFVSLCTKNADILQIPVKEGVPIENHLAELISAIS